MACDNNIWMYQDDLKIIKSGHQIQAKLYFGRKLIEEGPSQTLEKPKSQLTVKTTYKCSPNVQMDSVNKHTYSYMLYLYKTLISCSEYLSPKFDSICGNHIAK